MDSPSEWLEDNKNYLFQTRRILFFLTLVLWPLLLGVIVGAFYNYTNALGCFAVVFLLSIVYIVTFFLSQLSAIYEYLTFFNRLLPGNKQENHITTNLCEKCHEIQGCGKEHGVNYFDTGICSSCGETNEVVDCSVAELIEQSNVSIELFTEKASYRLRNSGLCTSAPEKNKTLEWFKKEIELLKDSKDMETTNDPLPGGST